MNSIHVVNWKVESGNTSDTIDFTPKNGEIIGVCIYQDDETKTGQANLVDQNAASIVDMVDLRHWRNRETAYEEGYIPVSVVSQPMTFTVKLKAAPVTNVTGQLVLIYKSAPKQSC